MSGGRTGLQTAALETTWGCVRIDASGRGVAACHLPRPPAPPVPFRVLRARVPRDAGPVLRRAVGFARSVVEGRDPGRCPALDGAVLSGATSFRRAVWAGLRGIPRGGVATYGELARRAGRPRAARAAGGACGANPLPLFVPCHRVVAAGGRLGGFSAGRAWKTLLLSGEGVRR